MLRNMLFSCMAPGQMERERHKVYHAFMFVPKAVIRKLHKLAQLRWERVMNPTENGEDLPDADMLRDFADVRRGFCGCSLLCARGCIFKGALWGRFFAG